MILRIHHNIMTGRVFLALFLAGNGRIGAQPKGKVFTINEFWRVCFRFNGKYRMIEYWL
jgi:hypothetical protein